MWQPTDVIKFQRCYMAGMSDTALANLFSATVDQVKNYSSQQREDKILPFRKDFDPDPGLVDQINDESEFIELALLKKVKNAKNGVNIIDLANEFDISPKKVQECIKNLALEHYLVKEADGNVFVCETQPKEPTEHFMKYVNGNKFKFGLIADTHIGSNYASYNVLYTMYDIFEREGIEKVYLPGNYVDGEKKFNRADLEIHGFERQVKHFVKTYPKKDGITTYFIDGDDHEGWWRQDFSINVGERVEDTAKNFGREDLKYLGFMEHTIKVPAANGCTKIMIMHPGGGSAYSLSYVPQKIIESLSGGEKPHILLLGHYHKAGFFFMRNIQCVMAGCAEYQTPFMRKKRLAAHLGGWIIEVTQGDDGSVLEFTPRFFPFYDTKDSADEFKYREAAEEWKSFIDNIPDRPNETDY